MRAAGSEAAELTMWYAMRAALRPEARNIYSCCTLPAVAGRAVAVLEE